MSGFIRAFVALDIPADVRDTLGHLSQQLDMIVPARAVRWVKPESMHLTLSFLGDGVTAVQVTQIGQLLDQIAQNTHPFTLRLDKLGCFPKPLAPRVIWAGLNGDLSPLRQLKTTLDDGLHPLGWPPERRNFNPHLTLGRVKDTAAVARAGLPFGTPLSAQSFAITAVHLYQSELTRHGAQYEICHSAPFTAAPKH